MAFSEDKKYIKDIIEEQKKEICKLIRAWDKDSMGFKEIRNSGFISFVANSNLPTGFIEKLKFGHVRKSKNKNNFVITAEKEFLLFEYGDSRIFDDRFSEYYKKLKKEEYHIDKPLFGGYAGAHKGEALRRGGFHKIFRHATIKCEGIPLNKWSIEKIRALCMLDYMLNHPRTEGEGVLDIVKKRFIGVSYQTIIKYTHMLSNKEDLLMFFGLLEGLK